MWLLFEGGDYSRAASKQRNTVLTLIVTQAVVLQPLLCFEDRI